MPYRSRSLGLAAAGVVALSILGCSSKDSEKAAAAAPPAGSSAGSHASGEHALAEMTVDEVEARIAKNDGKFFVYDCNQREMFDSGHVPTAKFLEYRTMTEADLAPSKDADLLFYCSNEH
ncbi:MAG TPA: hypothetical protein VL400_09710 [Polyangiaceae bacterium]|jgi:hypothetical protein|nr:hypothetical protein [Polyangiaceae bacterium]